jgi:CheY-like chemotaxis protein
MKTRRPILLVEDDQIDVMTVRRALKDLKVSNQLEVRQNGEDALVYLKNQNQARPCLILLDLRMPRMNGLEFLEEIKKDQNLRTLPVVVMTSSEEEQDILQSYQHGIAGYIVKPVDYQSFVEALRTVDLYWTLSKIPP